MLRLGRKSERERERGFGGEPGVGFPVKSRRKDYE
jgi:hypothetical protein